MSALKEHRAWIGTKYPQGIQGQSVAIVGYSHYRHSEQEDSADFTERVVRSVLSGDQRGDSFFPSVPTYFGFEEIALFWDSVLFFNFIPECIGINTEKYATGTPEQHARACTRFMSILQKHKPDKVFIFSTKAWSSCPLTIEEEAEQPCTPLGDDSHNACWGKYVLNGHEVIAIGLRHPQYANRELMIMVVREALKL